MIPAEVHSDDYVVEVAFDAQPWFEQATDEEIQALIDCNFGGDYAADIVAEYFQDKNAQIARLFKYLDSIRDLPSKKDCCGFECHVDGEKALAWVNRSCTKE